MDSLERCEYDTTLHLFDQRTRQVFKKTLSTIPLKPIPRLLPGYCVVQVSGRPFIELTMTLQMSVQSHFRLKQNGAPRKSALPKSKQVEKIEKYYYYFEQRLLDIRDQMIEDEIAAGLDPVGRYRVEFSRDVVISFFYRNKIPFLYPLPLRIMELNPNLPELIYPEVRQAPNRSHWAVARATITCLRNRLRSPFPVNRLKIL
jgi:hypothetical protein